MIQLQNIAIQMLAMKKAKPELERMKKAADGIETMFVKDLLKQMRKSVKESHFGESAGSDIYRDMLDQAISDSVGKSGSLGISRTVYKQFEQAVWSQFKKAVSDGKIDWQG